MAEILKGHSKDASIKTPFKIPQRELLPSEKPIEYYETVEEGVRAGQQRLAKEQNELDAIWRRGRFYEPDPHENDLCNI